MTTASVQNVRGPLADHIVVRLADEGVPLSAIGRAVRRPYAEVHAIVVEAREAGHLVAIPPSDWPIGSRRDSRVPESTKIILGEMYQMMTALMRLYGLQPNEAKILAALVKHPDRTKASLHAVIDDDRKSGPKIIDVYICRMRKKLRPKGIVIETVWGRGVMLPPAARSTILKEVEGFDAALTRLEA
ncbi:helix-turn-helix domain-containing protein [Ancylobacter sp. VNQ12]|uniref:helix-turn-helix domain-containing protein n=1 Tax=Ancylobacter sp. VNQ12 TaxID=3400920 RepID=UPI003C0EB404